MPEVVAQVMLVMGMVAIEALAIALIAAPKAVLKATCRAFESIGVGARRQLTRWWPKDPGRLGSTARA